MNDTHAGPASSSLRPAEALCALSATELHQKLRSREVSSVEVARAYLARIDRLDGDLRAYTEVLREGALASAEEADRAFASGEDRGPLQGLPLSVKECFGFEGRAVTLGIPKRLGTKSERDAALVTLAKRQGAVLVGRTNLSQFMLTFECANPLFGTTANPHARTHTPGGSSGGEGAAIASGTSLWGLGTDIGGSIRIPAHFTGICGFKPTLDRWPLAGIGAGVPGQEVIRGQSGPMARTARDTALLFRAFDPVAMGALDGRVPPVRNEDPSEIAPEGIRVGLMLDNGVLTPSLACLRALHRAADVLRAAGMTVVPFTPPRVPWAIGQYFRALSSDGARTIRNALGDGELDPNLGPLKALAMLPAPARKAAAIIARTAGETLLGSMLDAMGEKSVTELWALTWALRGYRLEVERALSEANIDVVLGAPFATPAVPHHDGSQFALGASYTMLWNLLQFPAGVVPVTTVRAHEATRVGAKQRPEKLAEKIDRASAGLPVGVQLAARPWRDATVLRAMQAVEDGVRSDEGFPTAPIEPR